MCVLVQYEDYPSAEELTFLCNQVLFLKTVQKLDSKSSQEVTLCWECWIPSLRRIILTVMSETANRPYQIHLVPILAKIFSNTNKL